ncbi:MAG TPA: hypothetical protein VHA78_05840 [Candidatus Peribacteraceae bacterium]|nr:hypothetical protein [Candidatus Peribacteraceae bacterium]
MLRPSAPDSSEKTSSFGINRRNFLDAALCAGILVSGIACFETGVQIRRLFQEPQPDATTAVPGGCPKDHDEKEAHNAAMPVETIGDGESLLNRPLSFSYENEHQEECSVAFRLVRNENGLFLEVEGETYVCDQTFMWVEVYRKIETAVIGRNRESDERLVAWGAKTYGTKITPLKDVTASAKSIRESFENEVSVDTSIGNLVFKKMPKPVGALAQVSH